MTVSLENLEGYEADVASWIGNSCNGVNIEVGFVKRDDEVDYYAHAWVDTEHFTAQLLHCDGPHTEERVAIRAAVDAAVSWCVDNDVEHHIPADIQQYIEEPITALEGV